MTLQRLQLRNFQRHENLKIVLDPLVTTIVGSSDAGKSSVVRALRWLSHNKPSGDAFVRRGESLCSVSLWVDGRKVSRRKGSATNEYFVDGEVYRSFGSDVPEPVADVLDLGDVNFQLQHDSPFWFSLTAGQVSRELNGVVDLDVIDRTLTGVASALRKARSVEEVCRERLESARRETEELSWVPEMAGEFDGLVALERDAEEGARDSRDLENLLDAARGQEDRARVEIPDLSELEGLRFVAVELERGVEEVAKAVREANLLRETIIRGGRDIELLKKELEEESGGVCPLCGSQLKGAKT